MNEHAYVTEDTLNIIREVDKNPVLNQRLLSQKLNISLGKTNYLLRALAQKGFIKIVNFTKFPKKSKQRAVKYLLTKKGLTEKINLTQHFLKVKEKEYERLKEEYDRYITHLKETATGGKDNA